MTHGKVTLDGNPIEYSDTGSGPPILFVHGVLVTGAIWDDAIAGLSGGFRCIAPTWPFGAHRIPLGADAALSVPASIRLIGKILDALDLTDVTLVANDTGGGIVLAALADSGVCWDRVSRLVFTNCDSFENFPPPGFAPMARLCRTSSSAGTLALRLLATSIGRRRFASMVTRHGICRPAEVFGGFIASTEIRREAVRFIAGLHPRYTLAATEAIAAWTKPVLVAWGADDPLFPISDAERLADSFPRAQLRVIRDCATYVMFDQHDELVDAIRDFAGH